MVVAQLRAIEIQSETKERRHNSKPLKWGKYPNRWRGRGQSKIKLLLIGPEPKDF